jgi:hypothetical protein
VGSPVAGLAYVNSYEKNALFCILLCPVIFRNKLSKDYEAGTCIGLLLFMSLVVKNITA